MNEEKKAFLAPDYDSDDEDDDIDDFEDDDIDEDGEEEATENFLDNNYKNNNTMTAFGNNNSGGSSWGNTPGSIPSWGGNPGSNSTPWSNNQGTSIWGGNNSNPWQKPNGNTWGNTWGNNGSGNIWSSGNEKKSIDRTKRIIFCDILDCLVETYQSNGRPGLLPRGIYDIKFRFDVWDKLACFNPEKIYAIVPRSLLNSGNEISWRVLLEYIVCSLSEYLRAPYQVCQILLQTEIGQPKEEIMLPVLKNIDKEKTIHIGVNSGLYGQNNKDQVASNICGIDYVDLSTFMSSYF